MPEPRTVALVTLGCARNEVDSEELAGRLAAAGVPTEVRVWPGQIHDFQLAAPVVPEAKRSLRQIGEYIREATG